MGEDLRSKPRRFEESRLHLCRHEARHSSRQSSWRLRRPPLKRPDKTVGKEAIQRGALQESITQTHQQPLIHTRICRKWSHDRKTNLGGSARRNLRSVYSGLDSARSERGKSSDITSHRSVKTFRRTDGWNLQPFISFPVHADTRIVAALFHQSGWSAEYPEPPWVRRPAGSISRLTH